MMPRLRLSAIQFVFLFCTVVTIGVLFLNDDSKGARVIKLSTIEPVAEVKEGNKWIIVTSISSPTEDVKVFVRDKKRIKWNSNFRDWHQ
uniref:DPPIV_N domain-containing protein n=1 Tax=Caenorhabditis tropicalis TaxID=1561998 RepID=A0A1I7V442_9PELO